jgi:hypothetical protein
MHRRILALLALVALTTLIGSAFAHQTIAVGEGERQVLITFGMTREPIFTDERNAFDLIVRSAAREPIEGLAASLTLTLIAPNGAERTFTLRPQYGRPGAYTDDLMLTLPGIYRVHVTGFVGELAIDVTFETHPVRPIAELAFP